MIDNIEFESASKPSVKELIRFYQRQQHKTTCSSEKLQRMVDESFCLVTARCDGELIGLARGVTDGLTGRLAECKLDPRYQGPACVTRKDGRIEHDLSEIAAEMATRVIQSLRRYGVERIEVVAHGTEVDFCEELGFQRIRGAVALELLSDVAPRVPSVATAEHGV